MPYSFRSVHEINDVNEQLQEIEENLIGMEPPLYPTLLNSWVDVGGTYQVARFWKTSNNLVYLEGVVKDGTIGTDMFVLPKQYRPAQDLVFSIISNGSLGRVDIFIDGGVQAVAPSSNQVALSLCGIVFRAEQK